MTKTSGVRYGQNVYRDGSGNKPAYNLNGDVWAGGKEAWCNMPGRYTTIVADYNEDINSYHWFKPSLCSIGIFGTRYIRNEPLRGSLPVRMGSSRSMFIPHIFFDPDYEITNILSIHVRQKAGHEVGVVELTDFDTGTLVSIDATNFE